MSFIDTKNPFLKFTVKNDAVTSGGALIDQRLSYNVWRTVQHVQKAGVASSSVMNTLLGYSSDKVKGVTISKDFVMTPKTTQNGTSLSRPHNDVKSVFVKNYLTSYGLLSNGQLVEATRSCRASDAEALAMSLIELNMLDDIEQAGLVYKDQAELSVDHLENTGTEAGAGASLFTSRPAVFGYEGRSRESLSLAFAGARAAGCPWSWAADRGRRASGVLGTVLRDHGHPDRHPESLREVRAFRHALRAEKQPILGSGQRAGWIGGSGYMSDTLGLLSC
ncbi:hypothetical protein AURANDRAFT_67715 [Aureococcus anophagefferens]|uniref:Uncharacterized protein n=1 Tax=Aureococcus anophagefferens TaxID=44056 RepID=F0YM54_AURAN|nr:hypothetical protein AURANDRAFT_67715 [Aureococcus anophagefferens]EGB03825.1 hypothetical protein AURANDRAFT_67715 [Aureococcus anophagefferens]|eukprot:XP_009041483.1 hypothetical protein AURANDRAFT_67715 [Aureococcus anophagefferens]